MAHASRTPPANAHTSRELEATHALAVTGGERSLGSLTGHLAEVAHAVRQAAGRPSELNDIDGVVADITSTLGDLAVYAELTANAVIDADRAGVASRTATKPSPGARAVSWRLRALASQLRAARDVGEAARDASVGSHGVVGSRVTTGGSGDAARSAVLRSG